MNRTVLIGTLSVLLTLLPALSFGQDMPLPANVQVPLLLKVLRYDRSLQDRGSDRLHLGVLYQSGFRDSARAQLEFVDQLDSSGTRELLGREVTAIPIDLEEITDLASELARLEIDLVYVAPLRAFSIAELLEETRLSGVATMSGVPDYVDEGLSFGVTQRGKRPAILVNLVSCREEGIDFSADLLSLAEIVDRD